MADVEVWLEVRVSRLYHVTIKDGQVVFANEDKNDTHQKWIKRNVPEKDEFALIQKYGGQTKAIKYAGANAPVDLDAFNINDTSQLWTYGTEVDGYFPVRPFNDVGRNLSADEGVPIFGNGTRVVVAANWNGHEQQLWKKECKFGMA